MPDKTHSTIPWETIALYKTRDEARAVAEAIAKFENKSLHVYP